MIKIRLLFVLLVAVYSFSAIAYDGALLTKKWQHTPFELYLTAQEAYDLKTNNPNKVLLLDVRNQAELHYTGIAKTIDANIPYRFDSSKWKMKKNGKFGTFKMILNPNFATSVINVLKEKKLTKNSPVIIMCATGTRAPFAAKALHKAGFAKVYTQIEGFEGVKAKQGMNKGKRIVSGWKVSNLPWSYDLVPEKMYFNYSPQNSN